MTPEERKQILIDYLETGALQFCPRCNGVGCDYCDEGVLDFLDVMRGGKAKNKRKRPTFIQKLIEDQIRRAIQTFPTFKKEVIDGKSYIRYKGDLIPLTNAPAFLKSKVEEPKKEVRKAEEKRVELPFCECGCGRRVTLPINRFLVGHNSKGVEWTEERRRKMAEILLEFRAIRNAIRAINKYTRGWEKEAVNPSPSSRDWKVE